MYICDDSNVVTVCTCISFTQTCNHPWINVCYFVIEQPHQITLLVKKTTRFNQLTWYMDEWVSQQKLNKTKSCFQSKTQSWRCEILFCSTCSKNAPFISKYKFSSTFSKLSFHLLDGFLNLNNFLADKIPLPLVCDRHLGFSIF